MNLLNIFKNKTCSRESGELQKGFTLIEVMITVAIIGLLTSVVAVSVGSVREKARDTRRKSDVDQIRKSLEIYFSDHDKYPSTGGNWVILNGVDDLLTPELVPKYLELMPSDPKNTDQLPFVYKYASDGGHFALDASLEGDSKDDHVIGVWETYDVFIYRLLSSG